MASEEPGTTSGAGCILDLLNGFRASQTLFVCVELGVFDSLNQADTQQQGLTTAEMAQSLTLSAPSGSSGQEQEHASLDGLARLLDAACALSLLRKKGPATPGEACRYTLTDVSREYLTATSPHNLAGYVTHSAKVIWPMFSGLKQAVIKGGNVWQECMGFSGSEIFSHIYSDEAALLRFMGGMHSFSALSAHAVVTAFDLSKYKEWLDLGGATGALMVAGAAVYPHARMVVVDLPHVVKAAEQHFTRPPFVQDAKLLDRVRWVAGDFFTSPGTLPRGDLVVLSRILHDWQPEVCRQLLATAYDMLPSGGAVLIAEMLLNEDGAGPVGATLQSLNMLVQTHGRERSALEYQAMLEGVGFSGVRAVVTGSYLDAVLAVKP